MKKGHRIKIFYLMTAWSLSFLMGHDLAIEMAKAQSGGGESHLFLKGAGSLPYGAFASHDASLAEAGFAETGLGFGIGGDIYFTKSGLFAHVGVGYYTRSSAVWENSLIFIQEALGASSRGSVIREISYRHVPFVTGFGIKMDMGQSGGGLFLRGLVGVMWNGISNSSVRVGDERTRVEFVATGDIKPCWGGSISLLSGAGIGIEAEYLTLFSPAVVSLTPEAGGGPSSIATIPVSMINLKVIVAIVSP